MGTESLQANIDLFIPGSIKIKGHGHCHHLSGYGSQGGPGNFHPGEAEQSKDHDGIKDDIGDSTDQDREHPCFGKSLRGDECVHPKGKLDKNSANRIDVHVVDTILDGIFAGTKRHEEITVPDEKNSSQHS